MKSVCRSLLSLAHLSTGALCSPNLCNKPPTSCFLCKILLEALIIDSAIKLRVFAGWEGGKRSAPPLKLNTIQCQLITQVLVVLNLRHCCKLSNEEVAQRFCLDLVELERGR